MQRDLREWFKVEHLSEGNHDLPPRYLGISDVLAENFIEEAKFSKIDFLVLLTIAPYVDLDGRIALEPFMIANRLGISTTQVNQSLNRMTASHAIRERRGDFYTYAHSQGWKKNIHYLPNYAKWASKETRELSLLVNKLLAFLIVEDRKPEAADYFFESFYAYGSRKQKYRGVIFGSPGEAMKGLLLLIEKGYIEIQLGNEPASVWLKQEKASLNQKLFTDYAKLVSEDGIKWNKAKSSKRSQNQHPINIRLTDELVQYVLPIRVAEREYLDYLVFPTNILQRVFELRRELYAIGNEAGLTLFKRAMKENTENSGGLYCRHEEITEYFRFLRSHYLLPEAEKLLVEAVTFLKKNGYRPDWESSYGILVTDSLPELYKFFYKGASIEERASLEHSLNAVGGTIKDLL